MQPVMGQWITVAFRGAQHRGLGHLEFVMGIDVVVGTGVNIEKLSEVLPAHGHAFDMPAGEATAPGTLPAHLVQGIGSPQIDIEWISLLPTLCRHGVALGLLKLLEAPAAKTTDLLVAGDVEVEIASLGVGRPGLFEQSNCLDHFLYMLTGLGILVRAPDTEGTSIGLKKTHLVLCQFPGIASSPARGNFNNVLLELVEVSDISDVHHLQDLVAGTLEMAAKHIGQQVGTELADMDRLVDGRTAMVHAYLPGLDGAKIFDGATKRIFQFQCHEDTSIRLCFFLPARNMIHSLSRSAEVSTLSSSAFSSFT